VIRKFSAIVRHRQAGYERNVMALWAVPEEACEAVGNLFASQPEITHCYERTPPFAGRYNLFTMIHFRSEDPREWVEKLAAKAKLDDYRLLFSEEEYKKSSMDLFLSSRAPLRNEYPSPWRQINHGSFTDIFCARENPYPGGVNSPVRACGSVGTTPLFISRAEGATIIGRTSTTAIHRLCPLLGALILGHAHPEVTSAIAAQMGRGTSYGAPTTLEIDMAATVAQAFPSMEMIRMVNSGTEAVMSAIRLARGRHRP
jgi:DNA-binding Lrp family transcriptional regulator